MFIVRHRRIFFSFSAALLALSFYGIFAYGFNLSIDFKGGTITEVRFDGERPPKESIEAWVSSLELGGVSVRPTGETSYVIRTRELSEAEREGLRTALGTSSATWSIERQNTIGPVAGAELRNKSLKALAMVVVMILIFITFAFRKVSKPVSSWKYASATVIALFHDVIIPTGAFVFLGYFFGLEIDLLFVSGLLAILGFSVHDTIVVFDRVREHLRVNNEKGRHEHFDALVGRSLIETMSRSINTSLTLFVILLVLYLVGSSATKDFSLLMMIGTIVGAYSSIFVAAPLLVTFSKSKKK